MRQKLIICDMDGTIIDSMPFLEKLAIALVAAEGHSADMMQQVYAATFGRPINEQFFEFNQMFSFAPPIPVEKLTKLYESVHTIAAPNFPFTTFGETVARWRWDLRPDWKLALISSTHRDIVMTMPQLTAIPWTYVGGRTVKGTNKKYQMLTCCEKLGVFLEDCVYVGDAPSDKELAADMAMPFFLPEPHSLNEIFSHAIPLAALPEVHSRGESSRRA